MKEKETELNGSRIHYLGKIPESKRVFILSSYSSSRLCTELYASAFEAVKSGFSVFFIPFSECAEAIECGIIDGKGSLNYILPVSLRKTSHRILNKALITSGSAITAESDSSRISRDSIRRAKAVGFGLADAILFADDLMRYKNDSIYIDSALERGAELAVFRKALTSAFAREYVYAGAPVISTFSDFLIHPKLYLYQGNNGHYGFRGTKFAIMNVSDD